MWLELIRKTKVVLLTIKIPFSEAISTRAIRPCLNLSRSHSRFFSLCLCLRHLVVSFFRGLWLCYCGYLAATCMAGYLNVAIVALLGWLNVATCCRLTRVCVKNKCVELFCEKCEKKIVWKVLSQRACLCRPLLS